jgi:serine/threonine protein kinase
MSLSPNTILSHYRIVSKIGEGGMGEVYLAQDTKLDRRVALKILPDEVAADVTRMRRFVQEAKAASALNHPNIITIHEIEQIDSINFIATEFIEGETLRQHLSTGMEVYRRFDAIQITGALAAAHAAGIIHRDIKPENIMVRRDGYIKFSILACKIVGTRKGQTLDQELRPGPWLTLEPAR